MTAAGIRVMAGQHQARSMQEGSFNWRNAELLRVLADVVETGDYLWGFAGSPMSIEFAQARDDFKTSLDRLEAIKP